MGKRVWVAEEGEGKACRCRRKRKRGKEEVGFIIRLRGPQDRN